jgi:chitinase
MLRSVRSAMLLFVFCVLLSGVSYSAVVFETTFDNVPTWNPNAYDACWQTIGIEGGGNACTKSPWSGTWVDANTIWNDYRVLGPQCSTIYASHIGSASDITALKSNANFTPYGSTGKSYVHFYEPCMSGSGGFGSDGLLGVYFGKDTGYSELYVQMKVRFQPGFLFANGSLQKLIHIAHFDETVSQGVLQAYNWFKVGSAAPNSPDYVGAIYTNTTYHPYPQFQMGWVPPDGSQCTSQNCSGAPVYPAATNMADGNWHTIMWHLKLNTAAGVANGIAEAFLDGALVVSWTAVPWTQNNTPTSVRWGFNRVVIGGNSDNIFGTADGRTQWYAVDDLVVSTTPIPSNYVLGGGSTPTLGAPQNLKVVQ